MAVPYETAAFLVSWVLAAAYVTAFILALVLLLRLHYYAKLWTMQKKILCSIALCLSCRAAFWLVVIAQWDEEEAMNFLQGGLSSVINGRTFPTLDFVLNEFPGMLSLTTVFLLLLFWANTYYSSLSSDDGSYYDSCFRPCSMAWIFIVWAAEIGLWIFYAYVPDDDNDSMALIEVVSTSIIAIAFSCLGIFLLVFGARSRQALHSVPVDFSVLKSKVREMGTLSKVCLACFTLRALIILASSAYTLIAGPHSSSYPWLTVFVCLFYYLALEIVPMVLILYYFRKLPPRSPAQYRGGVPFEEGLLNHDGALLHGRLFGESFDDGLSSDQSWLSDSSKRPSYSYGSMMVHSASDGEGDGEN